MADQWYVRRGGQVRGPFPEALVKRFATQGKLRDGDELSPDHRSWTPVADLQERFPVPAAPTPAGTPEPPPGPWPPASKSARSPGATQRLTRRYIEKQRRSGRQRRLQLAGIVCALAVAAAGVLSFAGPSAGPGAQCDLAPGPGVDLSGCLLDARDLRGADLAGATLRNARMRDANLLGARLTSTDLSYAELARAELTHADLRGARLMGTNLQRADLAYAKLGGADLAYADLSGANLGNADLAGARLDNAIWIDGRTCGPGSTGGCRLDGSGEAR